MGINTAASSRACCSLRASQQSPYRVACSASKPTEASVSSHEVVHRLVGRRLGREVTGVFRVMPKIGLSNQLEPGGLDFSAQCTLLDAIEALTHRNAGSSGMIRDHGYK